MLFLRYMQETFLEKFKVSIIFYSLVILIVGAFFIFHMTSAALDPTDTDGDGISDYHEVHKYFSDPQKLDTDGDGYDDGTEIWNGFSPLHKEPLSFKDMDTDQDGLSDDLELKFRTNIRKADTDGDGYSDKTEIEHGYDPKVASPTQLTKHIEVFIDQQKVRYYLDGVEMGEYTVSTGLNDSTPRGEFYIGKKIRRAWSRSAKLWMPYWMPFDRHLYGFHELPEWPDGTKEGEDHLGQAVSGGCIRLGEGQAKELYEWTPEGTRILIH